MVKAAPVSIGNENKRKSIAFVTQGTC